jgi:hypothetical protein
VALTDCQTFIDSWISRETSIELMRAIAAIASNLDDANRIWDNPAVFEVWTIKQALIDSGIEPEDQCWGACGTQWFTN